jgi:hypothetical protein
MLPNAGASTQLVFGTLFYQEKSTKQGKISVINKLLHYVQKNEYIFTFVIV